MGHSHLHTHEGSLDDLRKGIDALKVSWVILIVTAIFQGFVVAYSGSAALLADTLHNVADAFTAIPLWVAFALEKKLPTRRFTYGFSRFEDLAGALIVLLIAGTGAVVAYESYQKLMMGTVPSRLGWVAAASIIGFVGNEWVARYRMRVGREINSEALIADGHHARADSLTSLGVLAGVIGVKLGFPLADPLVGFVIAIAILRISWSTGKSLFSRLADAVSPEMVDGLTRAAAGVKGVLNVHDVRARYVGRHLRVELTIEVEGKITVFQGHEIAVRVQHEIQHLYPSIVSPAIHVDPKGHEGEQHHYEAHHHHE
jgi:cation diffusion facilitator family transporter